ncbi:MAG: hypothetical protein CSA22_10470 [Deltaproteobacteria bacterium]|nr:MAG: hypothetical protein CSA22_10470 [Deltaproteobacteria bacterium]
MTLICHLYPPFIDNIYFCYDNNHMEIKFDNAKSEQNRVIYLFHKIFTGSRFSQLPPIACVTLRLISMMVIIQPEGLMTA